MTGCAITDYIKLKIDGGLYEISTRDILYIQALGNYVKIICKNRAFLTLITLKELEQMLDAPRFLRIHKSFIVNTGAIEQRSNAALVVRDRELPIGKTYKKQVREQMGL